MHAYYVKCQRGYGNRKNVESGHVVRLVQSFKLRLQLHKLPVNFTQSRLSPVYTHVVLLLMGNFPWLSIGLTLSASISSSNTDPSAMEMRIACPTAATLTSVTGLPRNRSPELRTGDSVRLASVLRSASARHIAPTSSGISKSLFKPGHSVCLAAFDVRALKQAKPQAALSLILDSLDIDVCCVSETRIKDANTVIELTAPSVSTRSRLRTADDIVLIFVEEEKAQVFLDELARVVPSFVACTCTTVGSLESILLKTNGVGSSATAIVASFDGTIWLQKKRAWTRMNFQTLHGAYVRPLLEYANQAVCSGRRNDLTLTKCVQWEQSLNEKNVTDSAESWNQCINP
ncbi:polyprotein [Clonorchis sinensis]|uniref:Polyprotein n=1 Tax=Clonorchis sinensis TaxID=79923 RepID=G7YVR3_CLOSI|nr:polyprotein [Clonorchis sinensis]